MTTKARLTSRGRRTACTPPFTRAAATRPPTMEAAALSGCPSIWAATASGSLAPAAAAAATARAADEPSPRAMGIWERTVMARRSVPATSMATRAARWEGSSDSPAPSPSDRTISLEAGSTSTSTYRSRAMAKVSKPGPRLADDAGTRARTRDTVLASGFGPGRTAGRHPPRPPVTVGRSPTVDRADGSVVEQAPPPRRLGHGRGQRQRHRLGLGAEGEPGCPHRGSPRPRRRGPGPARSVAATCWPGHPSSEADWAATTATRC